MRWELDIFMSWPICHERLSGTLQEYYKLEGFGRRDCCGAAHSRTAIRAVGCSTGKRRDQTGWVRVREERMRPRHQLLLGTVAHPAQSYDVARASRKKRQPARSERTPST